MRPLGSRPQTWVADALFLFSHQRTAKLGDKKTAPRFIASRQLQIEKKINTWVSVNTHTRYCTVQTKLLQYKSPLALLFSPNNKIGLPFSFKLGTKITKLLRSYEKSYLLVISFFLLQ